MLLRPAVFGVSLLAALMAGVGIGALWTSLRVAPLLPEPAPVETPKPPTEPAVTFAPASFESLPGWNDERWADAASPLRASCRVLQARSADAVIGTGPLARPAATWRSACEMIAAAKDDAALKQAVEQAFVPMTVTVPKSDGTTTTTGTFTGYYEAELKGSLTRGGAFQVPIYGLPRDLVSVDLAPFLPPNLTPAQTAGLPKQIVGHVVPPTAPNRPSTFVPYFTRQDIDRDGAVAKTADVLIWADDPVAVHILHIQGSGRVTLPDGREMRIGFAGHNGHSFRGIGGVLLAAGVLKPGEAGMDKIRAWLTAHPAEAADYMNQNARYIFFRLSEAKDNSGPLGSLGVPLTPGRSLAVDPRFIPLGAPLWLDTVDPDGIPIRRLMAAQDTGAAITGAVRGDVFWGPGEAAFAKAARMKSPGRYTVLIPKG